MKNVPRPTYLYNFKNEAYQGPDSSRYKVDKDYFYQVCHWPSSQLLGLRDKIIKDQTKMVNRLSEMSLEIETLSHVIFVKKIKDRFMFDPRGWSDDTRDEYDENLLRSFEELSQSKAEAKLNRMCSSKSSLYKRFLKTNNTLFTLDYCLASRIAKRAYA